MISETFRASKRPTTIITTCIIGWSARRRFSTAGASSRAIVAAAIAKASVADFTVIRNPKSSRETAYIIVMIIVVQQIDAVIWLGC